MPPDAPFLLLVNPRAGAGRALRRLPELERALRDGGASFDTVQTEGPGHATELARQALGEGRPGIAVIGGDGTLSEAVNGYFDEQGQPTAATTWLGSLPCGTGGDFRRTLGLPSGVRAMVERLLAASPRPIDVGWMRYVDHEGQERQRAFMNIASFGMGGLVDQLVNAGPKWIGGTPAFFLGTLRAMARYRNRKVRLRLDDAPERETHIVNMAVANGRFFGGGMQIAPGAAIDDGWFDVVGIEGLGRAAQLAMAPHLYRGSLAGRKGVTMTRAKRIVAEPADAGGSVLLDVDGETPGGLPATFEIRPGAIALRA